MVSDPKSIRNDGQSGINGRTRDKKAAVDVVKIVHIMGFAIEIENRGLGVFAESCGSVLMSNAGKRDFLAEIGIAMKKMMRNAHSIEDRFELLFQAAVSFDVVLCIAQLQPSFFGDGDAVVGVREVFCC